MKLAWLVWRWEDSRRPEIVFTEPDRHNFKVVPIVYAEIVE